MELYAKDDFFAEQGFNLKKYLLKLLRKWPLFAATIPLALAVGIFIIKTTSPVYKISTTMMIKGEESTDRLLGEGDNMGGIKTFNYRQNLQNEMAVLTSFALAKQSVEAMDLGVYYFYEKNFRKTQVYKTAPFMVIPEAEIFQIAGTPIKIDLVDDQYYKVKIKTKEYFTYRPIDEAVQEFEEKVDFEGECKFGETCQSEYFSFTLQLLDPDIFSKPENEGRQWFFTINDINGIAESLQMGIQIPKPKDKATTIDLDMQTDVPALGIEFLNTLADSYQQNKLEEKNAFANGTIEFITGQLNSVTDSLQGAESQLANIRSRQSAMDLGDAARSSQGRLDNLLAERDKIQLATTYYQELLDQVQDDESISAIVAPSAMGIVDPVLTQLILDLKTKTSEKVATSYSSGGTIELKRIEQEIAYTRSTIIETVRGLLRASQLSLTDVNTRISRVRGRLSTLPESERNLVQVQRKFELNDQLFNFLQQKRAEAEIAKAANTPDSKIIDRARVIGDVPIAPNKPLILGLALLVGLFIPITVVWVQDSLNDKVLEIDQIRSKTKAPVLTSIPLGKKIRNGVDLPEPSTMEAFRFLQLKLTQFTRGESSTIIGITSSVPKEGKDYCSLNLAKALAFSGAKTLLIDFDIRKPDMHKAFMADNHPGVSLFLHGQAHVEESIEREVVPNLDLIPAGPLPTNLSEVLNTSNLERLFDTIKSQYQLIVVNTPPIGLVSDYLVLAPHIDITLFVVRQGYSKIKNLDEVDKLSYFSRLKNFYVIFNGVASEAKKMRKYGYYYSYGQVNGNGKSHKSRTTGKNGGNKLKQLISARK